MINFEEELKKFQPSPEVGDLEDTVYNLDVTDAIDMFIGVMEEAAPQPETQF